MHKGGGEGGPRCFSVQDTCAFGSTLLACIICCTAHAKGAVDVASVNQAMQIRRMMQFWQCMQLCMDSAMQDPVAEFVCILNLTAKQLCSSI